MSYYTNPKFLPAVLMDAVGKDDEAMAFLKVSTFEDHQEYRKDVAILCGALAVILAIPTFGISLLLLLVSLRKYMIIQKKAKQHEAELATMQAMQSNPALDRLAGVDQVDKTPASV